MKKKSILLKMVVLVAAMMCALGASAQEAYVCYTSSNSTLTFCYDIYRSSRPGTTYDLNTGEHDAPWRVHISVTDVVFEPSFAAARPTTTYNWEILGQRLILVVDVLDLNGDGQAGLAGVSVLAHSLR